MGVTKINKSVITQVSPDRMFKAMFLDSHNIVPKFMFSSISSIEFIQGDGDVGSIKQINFTEASPLNFVKHRIDLLDKENLMCKYTMTECDPPLDILEYATYEVKLEGYGMTGCVCRLRCEYKAKGDLKIKEDDIEFGKDRAIGMYEIVEAYLMAHPRAYT